MDKDATQDGFCFDIDTDTNNIIAPEDRQREKTQPTQGMDKEDPLVN
jgi:hypothetical protein